MDKINEFLARLTELIREIEELLEIVDRLALSLNLENLRRLLEDPKQKQSSKSACGWGKPSYFAHTVEVAKRKCRGFFNRRDFAMGNAAEFSCGIFPCVILRGCRRTVFSRIFATSTESLAKARGFLMSFGWDQSSISRSFKAAASAFLQVSLFAEQVLNEPLTLTTNSQ